MGRGDGVTPGMTLDGRYELGRMLGKGGMGMVFEARHLRLGRQVAVKILDAEYAALPEFQKRFEREARAATLLTSPHAVRVFDVAVAAEGVTYMVMELLSGNDLKTECDKGPIRTSDVADWVIQACSALQEAHDHGIIHRDIKPANIFIADEGPKRIAKLLDFGVSKFDERITSALTKPGVGVLGTPTFMSPEQIRGHRLDARTDIWSLGVVLYHVLGRCLPFAGATEPTYMAAVLSDEPLAFELVRPDLPGELARVIMRALEKRREHRYASAAELAAALQSFATLNTAPTARMAAIDDGVPDTIREASDHASSTSAVVAVISEPALPPTRIEGVRPRGARLVPDALAGASASAVASASASTSGAVRWLVPLLGVAAVTLAGVAAWRATPAPRAPANVSAGAKNAAAEAAPVEPAPSTTSSAALPASTRATARERPVASEAPSAAPSSPASARAVHGKRPSPGSPASKGTSAPTASTPLPDFL